MLEKYIYDCQNGANLFKDEIKKCSFNSFPLNMSDRNKGNNVRYKVVKTDDVWEGHHLQAKSPCPHQQNKIHGGATNAQYLPLFCD